MEYDDKTLKHLQNLELMVLKDFIKLCDENNLNYYIYGGSLLGAVRHKGFIPWDDDIDVIMFRDEFDKFKEIFLSQRNEKYELLSYEFYDDYFFLFPKIMLKGTKFEEWWGDQVSFTVGINIDIFVLDDVSDNKLESFIQIKYCRLLDRLLTVSSIKLKDYPFVPQLISNVSHRILSLFRIKPIKIINSCLKLLTKFENTEKVCDITALNHPQIYQREDFGKGVKIEFEDIMVNAPADSHRILEQIYGDYMKLPPKEERYNHMPYNLDFGHYEL